jgi:hypothetical protein
MAQQHRRIKHEATFEERLAEEAINLKKPRQHGPRTAFAASPAGRDGRTHERLATVPRVAAAEVKLYGGTK